MLSFRHFFAFGIIWSPSVQPSLVLVVRGSAVSVGDLAAYRYPGATIGDYRAGDQMVHWVIAGEGSTITVGENRAVFVDGKPVGVAKPTTYRGQPVDVVAPKVIPKDHFYVMGTDANSLDSRYEHAGLVARGDFIGRAIVLF
jgi:conjugal transfer pilin signal peptidase TrbI